MVNKVILIGRLGRDPELRYTSSGTPVANFSLATNEYRRGGRNDQSDSDDEDSREHTEWHNIVAWSRLAEICNQYLTKGKLVYIEGRLQTRDWEDRDGNKRRTTEVIASRMQMLGTRGEESASRPAVAVAEGSGGGEMEGGITDDDIPF